MDKSLLPKSILPGLTNCFFGGTITGSHNERRDEFTECQNSTAKPMKLRCRPFVVPSPAEFSTSTLPPIINSRPAQPVFAVRSDKEPLRLFVDIPGGPPIAPLARAMFAYRQQSRAARWPKTKSDYGLILATPTPLDGTVCSNAGSLPGRSKISSTDPVMFTCPNPKRSSWRTVAG